MTDAHMHEDYDYLREAFTYHPPKSREQIEKYERLRDAGFEFANLIRTMVPQSRETDIAIDSVRIAVMWANAGLALHGPDTEDVPDEVLHFFGKMSPEDARRIKDEWMDRKAYDDRVAESPAPTMPDAVIPEGMPPVTLSEPADLPSLADMDEMNEQTDMPIPEDMRIGTLRWRDIDGEKTCLDCVTGEVVETADYNLVCTLCGRTVQCLPDRPPTGCINCGMIEEHYHDGDRTFLPDGREIRILTGLTELLKHHGVEDRTPYVLVDDMQPEPEMSVHVDPAKGVSAKGVADLVKGFLDRNPNAMFEPVHKIGKVVMDTLTLNPPSHDHAPEQDCHTNCPRAQWERNR